MHSNSCDIWITNASVVIPKIGIIQTDILIENGKIRELKKGVSKIQSSIKIDAYGKYVLPGIIDPHVHYGVYTPIDEAGQTESRSAAIGGVTTMIRMLRLNKTYLNVERHLEASKGNHHIDYSIHASILTHDQLREISSLRSLGINSLKVYMNLGADLGRIFMDLDPYTHDVMEGQVAMTHGFISSIVEKAANSHSTVLVHAESPTICSESIRKIKHTEDERSGVAKMPLQIWSECRPALSESKSIHKITKLANRFGTTLYFVHVGSSDALATIMAERKSGNANRFYIETCPHYLTHTTEFNDIRGKVVPPLRSKDDVQSTWLALQRGSINTIGSDHVANRLDIKRADGSIWSALSGFPGIATMLPVLLSKGVNENRISIERLSEVTSYNTSLIFGMYPKKGTIQQGTDADLTIVDLNLEKTVTPEILQSYSDYTIYDGWKLKGWPVLTMVRGQIVMQDGEVNTNTLGHGEFIARPTVANNNSKRNQDNFSKPSD
jgi:dihydropyrimidinase